MDRILDYGSRDGGSNPPRCTKIPSFGGDFFVYGGKPKCAVWFFGVKKSRRDCRFIDKSVPFIYDPVGVVSLFFVLHATNL